MVSVEVPVTGSVEVPAEEVRLGGKSVRYRVPNLKPTILITVK